MMFSIYSSLTSSVINISYTLMRQIGVKIECRTLSSHEHKRLYIYLP